MVCMQSPPEVTAECSMYVRSCGHSLSHLFEVKKPSKLIGSSLQPQA